ncbi:MAG TPA: hypothetical protein VGG46_12490 [Terriglobales bacterium]|jgi:hypothetical protein
MKKIMLPFATVLLFALATFAQTNSPQTTPGSQGTQNESPSVQQTPSNDTGMSGAKHSEKKIKGCVAQQNGQYVLETKKGKSVPLSGQDVSAHVGHMVALQGTWAASAGAQTSTGMASGNSFNVTKVDMISDSCNMKGNMSTGSGSATPQQ